MASKNTTTKKAPAPYSVIRADSGVYCGEGEGEGSGSGLGSGTGSGSGWGSGTG
jgi:hypothetical protein